MQRNKLCSWGTRIVLRYLWFLIFLVMRQGQACRRCKPSYLLPRTQHAKLFTAWKFTFISPVRHFCPKWHTHEVKSCLIILQGWKVQQAVRWEKGNCNLLKTTVHINCGLVLVGSPLQNGFLTSVFCKAHQHHSSTQHITDTVGFTSKTYSVLYNTDYSHLARFPEFRHKLEQILENLLYWA